MYISDYNQALYDEVLEKIKAGYHQIFYSEATGLGKSIIMQMLILQQFAGKQVLYIAPKYSIWDNISQYEAMKCADCRMYAAFKDTETALDIIHNYDVIFIDECHHMYSDIQGASIQKAMAVYSNKYFFGFTATPKLKGKLASDAFEVGCIGLDVYDAVKQGIFPKIKYAILVPDTEGDICSQDIITQIQSIFEDRQKVGEKCLVYLTDIHDLESYTSLLKEAYPEYDVMNIHSKKTLRDNKMVLDQFNAAVGNVMLLSVDSLMEGVHLNGVHCVISCRHTQSLNVFLQIMGRLCKPYSKVEPLFIDVTDSVSDINFDLDEPKPKGNGTGQITQRSLKDMIDVHCKEYEYVEFYERLRSKDNKIQTYKDFTWSTYVQLAKQLGVSVNSIYSWLRRNVGSTIYDYIDYKTNSQLMYRGVDCSSYESMAVTLHKTIHDVKLVIKLNNMTRQEYVDFVLGGRTLDEYNQSLSIMIYRDIDCYSDETIARALHKNTMEVHSGIKRCGGALSYIDDVLKQLTLKQYLWEKGGNKKFSYHGIKYNTPEDICDQLGVTMKTYRAFMRATKADSPREFIDAYMRTER